MTVNPNLRQTTAAFPVSNPIKRLTLEVPEAKLLLAPPSYSAHQTLSIDRSSDMVVLHFTFIMHAEQPVNVYVSSVTSKTSCLLN